MGFNIPEGDYYSKEAILAMGILSDERAISELLKIITDEDYVKRERFEYKSPDECAFDALGLNFHNFNAVVQLYSQYRDYFYPYSVEDRKKSFIAQTAKFKANALLEESVKKDVALYESISLDGEVNDTINLGKLNVVNIISTYDKSYIRYETDLENYLAIPEAYRCESPEVAETIALITSYTSKFGTYDNGDFALSLHTTVTVVDRETRNLVARSDEFVSRPPEHKTNSGVGIGDIPWTEIMEFIDHLYKK